MPKKHNSNFDAISPEDCVELSHVVKQILTKIYKGLNNPDYNMVFFTSPSHERGLEYYHWHIKILPRVSETAGFEIGTGVFINTVIPEQAAKYLRDFKI